MSKHTRGPWRADIHPIIDIYIRRTDEEVGGVVATAYKHFGPEEGEANAHLIAAAPRMYDFVKMRAVEHGDTEARAIVAEIEGA